MIYGKIDLVVKYLGEGIFPKSFGLVNGKYEWTGKVNPANVKIKGHGISSIARDVAQFVGERLFADRPIHIEIIKDSTIGSKHGAEGASSTNKEGTHTQVYINTKKVKTAEGIVSVVSHELVHAWQRRNGGPEPNKDIPHEKRPEEIHARRSSELLAGEFIIKHGSKHGIKAPDWQNNEKYFKSSFEGL